LTADEKNIYVTDERGVVLAVDKDTGASVWRQDKLFMRRVSTPKVFGEYIVVGDYEGYVHFLRRDNGAFAARIATDGSPISVQPQVAENICLVQTRAGGIFALNLR
jgi:outer membrane protein assembly factor BamB